MVASFLKKKKIFFTGNCFERAVRNGCKIKTKPYYIMKKTLGLITALILFVQIASAQDEQQTLFGEKISLSSLGVMVEPGVQLTRFAGEGAGFFNFRGGIVFNDKLTLGGFYGQSINDVRPSSFDNSLPISAHLDSYMAGGFVEYTIYSNKLVHFTFPLSVGMMEVEIDNEGRDFDFDETKTLFVEPKAMLEINLHKFARLNAGVGYRIMGNTFENAPGVPDAGNALTFQIGLKMGVFSFGQLK
jgi:hypothetical protein